MRELGAESFEVQVSERGQAVIDRHHDHLVLLGQLRAVVADEAARAAGVTAAVQPDHDGTLRFGLGTGGPHVQPQAVLTERLHAVHALELGYHLSLERGNELRRARTELERIAHSGPALRLCRRHEAAGPRRAGAIRQALEALDLVLEGPSDLARGGLHRGAWDRRSPRRQGGRDSRARQQASRRRSAP